MRLQTSPRLVPLFAALFIAAVPPTPAQKHAIDYRVGNVEVCAVVDELEPDVRRRCVDARREFQSGEQVCVYTRFKNPRQNHRHRLVAYRDGEEAFVRDDAGTHVDSTQAEDEWWAHCEPDVALPGNWRFDLYADIGAGYELVGSRTFAMHAEQLYRFVDARTCAEVTTSAEGWSYGCDEPRSTFAASERAHLVAELSDVVADHRFRVDIRRDGRLVRTQTTDWNRVRHRWERSYFVPDVETVPGEYELSYAIDVGAGFEPLGKERFTVGLRAPVVGPLEMQCFWPEEQGIWAFCKHRPGWPHARHGVAMADDDRAWDINLRDYEDSGEWVYPMAPGRVVRYGGPSASRYNGAAGVLIEHVSPDGERWWSGYLHMRRDSIAVREGDVVEIDTPLGRIGRTGTTNSHLHAVVYRGENRKGGLRSFDAVFLPRSDSPRYAQRARSTDSQG